MTCTNSPMPSVPSLPLSNPAGTSSGLPPCNSSAVRSSAAAPVRCVGRPDNTVVGASSSGFVYGACASFVNIVLTYPMYKVLFRQQAEGIPVGQAARSVFKEGPIGMYKGIAPPLVQRTIALSLMFGLFDLYKRDLQRAPWWRQHDTTATCVAALASGSTEAVLAPLERVQTLLQHRHTTGNYRNTLHAAQLLAPMGVRELYRGVSAILIRNGPSNALFFALRGPLHDALPEWPEHAASWEPVRNFACGAVLGATLSTIFFPLNVAKAIMQSKVGGRHTSLSVTLRLLYRAGGVRRLFSGAALNYQRSLLSWGIINALQQELEARDPLHLHAEPER